MGRDSEERKANHKGVEEGSGVKAVGRDGEMYAARGAEGRRSGEGGE